MEPFFTISILYPEGSTYVMRGFRLTVCCSVRVCVCVCRAFVRKSERVNYSKSKLAGVLRRQSSLVCYVSSLVCYVASFSTHNTPTQRSNTHTHAPTDRTRGQTHTHTHIHTYTTRHTSLPLIVHLTDCVSIENLEFSGT